MPIGPSVRRLLGPYEHRITDAYRSMYVDIDAYVDQVRRWAPEANEILEVGCGEGAVTERLARAYPDARITGIDITPRVGRLYRGPTDRVRFLQCTVEDLAAREPGRYDLAMIVDVLHHVPSDLRRPLLEALGEALAPSAMLVVKEWERTGTPIHWMCYASDRWLTGDRIRYMDREEGRTLMRRSFGEGKLIDEARVRPWRNNILTLVRP